MSEILSITKSSYNNFNSVGAYLPLFFTAILFIYINRNTEERELFVYPSLICLALIMMPLSAAVIIRFIGADVFWRIWWLFPIIITLSYVGTRVVMIGKSRKEHWFVLLGLFVLISFSGKLIYNSETLINPENIFKLPNEVIWISELIHGDNMDGEDVRIIIPNEFVEYIRQFDYRTKLLYGREMLRGNGGSEIQLSAFEEMSSGNPNIDILAECARKGYCQYIVLSSDICSVAELATNDFEILGYAGGYTVYKDVLEKTKN